MASEPLQTCLLMPRALHKFLYKIHVFGNLTPLGKPSQLLLGSVHSSINVPNVLGYEIRTPFDQFNWGCVLRQTSQEHNRDYDRRGWTATEQYSIWGNLSFSLSLLEYRTFCLWCLTPRNTGFMVFVHRPGVLYRILPSYLEFRSVD
jgi:hypothetical protein